jgi:uncharacterized protein (UPF0333 family)
MKFSSIKLLLLLTAISFFSCKKNSDSNYYVKLKINGTWVTWKTALGELGPDLADASKTDLGVTANDDAGKDVFDLSIQIDGSNFTTGSYDSNNPNYWVIVSYAKNAAAANSQYFDISSVTGQPDSRYIVNITSITDKELRGTFSGNYLSEFISEDMLNVTEGEFVVRRIR